MDFSLESHEILPYVRVYTGAFPDIQEMLSVLFEHEKTSSENPEVPQLLEPYRPWYTFGRITEFDKSALEKIDDIPGVEHIQKQLNMYERVKQVREAVVANYCDIYKVSDFIDSEASWVQSSVNVAEYFPNTSLLKHHEEGVDQSPRSMNYHTDFEIKFLCEERDNFLLTCNIYWNDDYDGGEVVFFDSNKLYPYKPKSGEVLVFPSGSPYFPEGGRAYYHCANTVFNGKKYFSRNYLQYKHVPTEDMRNAINDNKRGDRNPGDSHYSSLYNQMFLVDDYGANKFLVHPIVKRFYETINSCYEIQSFSADTLN